MCGFFAILQDADTVPLESARRGLAALEHRGPDAGGEWHERGVFLGHRRLSIIDLATGDQPMHSADGRYVIVFNGEIYNFRTLRETLISEGAIFRTQSDTEVILEAYRRWGTRSVERLHGMFAFVIWDRHRSLAFGARDRIGIKPLTWALRRGTFIVASTLEPFASLHGFGSIDLISVRDLMAFDYIPAPRTIFQDVHKLEPGSFFEWSVGAAAPSITRYWRPPRVDHGSTVPDEAELEQLLDAAVERQMISDVPIAAFLSGGIDSSLIVAMMARHSHKPVRTFSVRFSEGGVDESPIAELVARRFRTDHLVLNAEDVGADALLDLLGRLDEPFCDPTVVPTYSLSQMTRCHVKVALSGDGGDEVFGGYPKYLLGEQTTRSLPFGHFLRRTMQTLPWRPRGAGRVMWHVMSAQERVRYEWSRYGNFPVFRKDMRQLFAAQFTDRMDLDNYFLSWERKARRYGDRFDTDVLMRADLETYLSENCLVKTDRASMLASLEVRVPFLDEQLLERILPLPAHRKIRQGQLKSLLMPMAKRLLPTEAWDRPKHGFTVPLAARLAGQWSPAVERTLQWGESHFPLFNYDYLRRLHRLGSRREIGRELWNPFVLLAWVRARSATLPADVAGTHDEAQYA